MYYIHYYVHTYVLLNISTKFLFHIECCLLSLKRHIKISKYTKQTKDIPVSLKRVIQCTSITVIYHAVSDCTLHIKILNAKSVLKVLLALSRRTSAHREDSLRANPLARKAGHVKSMKEFV